MRIGDRTVEVEPVVQPLRLVVVRHERRAVECAGPIRVRCGQSPRPSVGAHGEDPPRGAVIRGHPEDVGALEYAEVRAPELADPLPGAQIGRW